MNIFITSKGRYDKCKTADLFIGNKDAHLVVEPQELQQYLEKYPNFNYLVLDQNDQGLVYARNYIKLYAQQNKLSNYWLLDDDISSFYRREGTKLIKEEATTVLKNSMQMLQENNIALGGLEYRQFAWSANKDIIFDTFCDCAVFLDLDKMQGIYYNPELKLKIDRDMCIKTIHNNQRTARITKYAFSTPPNGSNKGGLKEIAYDKQDLEKDMCLKMVEIWGSNICKHIVKKDGRHDIKIYWKKINSNQKTLF